MLNMSVGVVCLVVMLSLGGCQLRLEMEKRPRKPWPKYDNCNGTSKLTADRVSNFSRVDVDTESGVVSLSGVVQSAEQRTHAEALARQVRGVTKVQNNLQIQQQGTRPGDAS